MTQQLSRATLLALLAMDPHQRTVAVAEHRRADASDLMRDERVPNFLAALVATQRPQLPESALALLTDALLRLDHDLHAEVARHRAAGELRALGYDVEDVPAPPSRPTEELLRPIVLDRTG